MKLLIITASLLLGAYAEEGKNCKCSENDPSRAATLLGKKQVTLTVIGMSCASCENALTEKLKKEKAIISVDTVDHAKKVVTVTVKPEVCESVVTDAITKAGYYVQPDKKDSETAEK